MSNQQTPEEVLDSIVEGINSGNIESLMGPVCMNRRHVLLFNQARLPRVNKVYAKVYKGSLT